MTHEDLIRGSQAILDFLQEVHEVDWSTFETPKMTIMEQVLSDIFKTNGNSKVAGSNIDMVQFTILANKEYQIMPEPLWKESPKEFFSTDKSIRFFNSILRDKKINQILS